MNRGMGMNQENLGNNSFIQGGAYLTIAKIWGWGLFPQDFFSYKKAHFPSTGNKNIPVKHMC